ncbi:MAG: HRDC domain-containing protein, partial [Dehalococcoidia bacterium]
DDPGARIDTSTIATHRAYAEARLREMAEYAETTGCRRGAILRYFGEEAAERCDLCDNCLGRHDERDQEIAFPEDLYDRVIEMRERLAREARRDPFLVFENRTAREIATYRPRSIEALRTLWGIATRRAAWFGEETLALVADWEREHPDAAPPPDLPKQPVLTPRGARIRDDGPEVRPDDPLFEALRAWRSERARSEGVPAYTLFSDRTLRELVTVKPRNVHALLNVWGLGESRVDRFGLDLVQVIREQEGG